MGKKLNGRKNKAPNERQLRALEAREQGKTYKQAGIIAGYPQKNAAQYAYQAISGLRGRVPELLDKAGLSEEICIQSI